MKFFLPVRHFLKIYISLAFFFIILVIGTVGYMSIEHYSFVEAFYMTVITLSTVGFTEVHTLSNGGRIFTSILILANIGTFTYFLTQLSNYFLDGEFTRTYKLYNMRNAINELEGHVILCGFGRNGAEAGRILSTNGKDFVVIEKEESQKNNLSFKVPYLLEADATRDETLIEAGVMRASALISTLPEDADNLYVVLTARELNPHIKIISRATNESSVRKLKTAGASNVIMPDKIGGAHMATLVISPDVREFVDMMSTYYSDHFNITEVECGRNISLQELDCWKRTGATVLGLKMQAGEYSLNPTPQTVINPGNRLIVMGSKDQIDKVKALVG